MEYITFTNILGMTAFIISVGAFQLKKSRTIILTQIPSNVAWMGYMFMVGAYAGVLTSLILIIRNFLTLILPSHYLKILVYALIPVVMTVVLAFSEGPIGTLSALGNILAGLSMLYRDNSLKFRAVQLLSISMFLSYGIFSGAHFMTAFGMLSIISNISGAIYHEDIFAPLRKRFQFKQLQGV